MGRTRTEASATRAARVFMLLNRNERPTSEGMGGERSTRDRLDLTVQGGLERRRRGVGRDREVQSWSSYTNARRRGARLARVCCPLPAGLPVVLNSIRSDVFRGPSTSRLEGNLRISLERVPRTAVEREERFNRCSHFAIGQKFFASSHFLAPNERCCKHTV